MIAWHYTTRACLDGIIADGQIVVATDDGMNREIIPASSTDLATLADRTRQTIDDAVPPNTRRAYEGDVRRFEQWCSEQRLVPLPAHPDTVVLYMRWLADEPVVVGKQPPRQRKVAGVERALAAICAEHEHAGHSSPWTHPLVSKMRKTLRTELGVRPEKKKAADAEVLRRMLAVVPMEGLLGLRDRALLTNGWAMAGRRVEIVELDVEDIIGRVPKGLVLLIRRSKTDQEAAGEEIPIFFSNAVEHCPVRSLDAWLAASGITSGAIFRAVGRRGILGKRLRPAAVNDRVKRWARLAGLDSDEFGAHSLRSGFVTEAARAGKGLDDIMRTTRHRSERIARGYIHKANPHQGGAGEGLL